MLELIRFIMCRERPGPERQRNVSIPPLKILPHLKHKKSYLSMQ